jgi:hypothetical protein
MPFSDDVNFRYTLLKEYNNITLRVYDLEGKLWVELSEWRQKQGLIAYNGEIPVCPTETISTNFTEKKPEILKHFFSPDNY